MSLFEILQGLRLWVIFSRGVTIIFLVSNKPKMEKTQKKMKWYLIQSINNWLHLNLIVLSPRFYYACKYMYPAKPQPKIKLITLHISQHDRYYSTEWSSIYKKVYLILCWELCNVYHYCKHQICVQWCLNYFKYLT